MLYLESQIQFRLRHLYELHIACCSGFICTQHEDRSISHLLYGHVVLYSANVHITNGERQRDYGVSTRLIDPIYTYLYISGDTISIETLHSRAFGMSVMTSYVVSTMREARFQLDSGEYIHL